MHLSKSPQHLSCLSTPCLLPSALRTATHSAHVTCFYPVDFLREDTLVGTSFLRVAAHDNDFGTNAAITYSMSSEQPEYLQVNPVTGWVYVNQPISQVSLQQSAFNVYITLCAPWSRLIWKRSVEQQDLLHSASFKSLTAEAWSS